MESFHLAREPKNPFIWFGSRPQPILYPKRMPCVNFWAKKAQNSNPHSRHSPVNTISIKLHLSRILIELSIQLSANTKNRRKKEINLKLCQANKERRATKGYKATVMVTRIGSRTLPDAWLYNAKPWKQYNAKTWKQPSIMTSKVKVFFGSWFHLRCDWHWPGWGTHEKLWLRKYSGRPTQKQRPLVKVQRFYWKLDINRTSFTSLAPTRSHI